MCLNKSPSTSPQHNTYIVSATASTGNRAYSAATSTSNPDAYHPSTIATPSKDSLIQRGFSKVKSTLAERGEKWVQVANKSYRRNDSRRATPRSRRSSQHVCSDPGTGHLEAILERMEIALLPPKSEKKVVGKADLETMLERMEMAIVPRTSEKAENGLEDGDGGVLLTRPATTLSTEADSAERSENPSWTPSGFDAAALSCPEGPDDYNYLGRLSDGNPTAPAELHEKCVAELPAGLVVHIPLATEGALVRDTVAADTDLHLQADLQAMEFDSHYSKLPLAPFPDPYSNEFVRVRTSTFSIVPAAADGRTPYPLTPGIAPSPLASANTTPDQHLSEPVSDRAELRLRSKKTIKRKPLPNPMSRAQSQRRKKALSMLERTPSKRGRERKGSMLKAQVSRRDAELHFDVAWLPQPRTSFAVLPPESAEQLEGDSSASITYEKALKRRSRSLPEMHADYEARTMTVSATTSTSSGTPDVLKPGLLKSRKSFPVGLRNDTELNLNSEQRVAWKSYLPRDTGRYSTYKPYVPGEGDLTGSVESSAALKAEKFEKRISSGVLPDQTSLTEVIQAATGKALFLETPGSPTGKVRDDEAESPVSTLREKEMAWAFVTAIARSELVNAESDIEPEPEPVVARIETLRRVQASQVDMRSLARPIAPGGTLPTKPATLGSLLDGSPPSNLPAAILTNKTAFAAQQSNSHEDSSWAWGRFSDKDYQDPAKEHSQRFKDKKTWAKKNSGDLIEFEKGNEWKRRSGVATTPEEKRLSLMGMMRDKNVEELFNFFEGKK